MPGRMFMEEIGLTAMEGYQLGRGGGGFVIRGINNCNKKVHENRDNIFGMKIYRKYCAIV